MFTMLDFSILWQTGEENYTIGVAEPVGEFGVIRVVRVVRVPVSNKWQQPTKAT